MIESLNSIFKLVILNVVKPACQMGRNLIVLIINVTGDTSLLLSSPRKRCSRSLIVLFIGVVIIFWNNTSFAQGGVYVSVNNSVYGFLERMDTKGVINYSDVIVPQTRLEISSYLRELKNKVELLTSVEQKDLYWYLKEYYYEELQNSNKEISKEFYFFKTPKIDRWNLFEYQDSVFHFVVNPIIGGTINYKYNEIELKRWTGLSTYFSLGKNWGGQFDYRDNWEKGEYIDRTKYFTNQTGIDIIHQTDNTIEYSEVKGAVTYESKYVNVSIGKEFFNWGSGYRSQLILSEKAPSFPFIRLDIKPVDWLRFYYIHGFLNSRVPDSSAFYNTQYQKEDSSYVQRIIDRPKFYAAHVLEFKIKKRIRFSIGESVVYSDQGPRAGFLIPVLFFRLVDHYYEGTGGFGKGSNSQIFFDLNFGLINNLNLYSTIFIDEFSLSKFLKGNHDRDQLGYTVGAQVYDLIIDNLSIRFEYTRIRPWVYSNFIQTQTYTNSSYLMGHYIGQNADQVFGQIDYYPLRGLTLSIWGEYIRQGGFDNVSEQYKDPGEPFLYGEVRKETNIGLKISYQIIHDLYFKSHFTFSNISDQNIVRTPSYQLGTNNSIGFSVFYGF
jgi:hypothetical protein